MGLFGKTKREKELEHENKILKELLAKQIDLKTTNVPNKKKVMYQCRYCGYKSIRNVSDGAPGIGNCPKHPNGWCKGVHSWMRIYL